jgi:anthranilate synthase component 1
MYFLHLDGCQILGSSPEVLVKTHNGEVITRPLAGTRPRGKTPNEDQALERELMANPKERAEHVMLLDLARNDIGRVCEPGSVRTTAVMEVERFSRLMHLVSEARGNLTPGREGMDVIRATFPAGTVSGAPKVRAMQIIDELEPVRRGVYAGAIGYLGANGNLDLCIAIRTIVLCHGRGFLQAGAGIVADSIPELEFEETALKAQALLHAISTG